MSFIKKIFGSKTAGDTPEQLRQGAQRVTMESLAMTALEVAKITQARVEIISQNNVNLTLTPNKQAKFGFDVAVLDPRHAPIKASNEKLTSEEFVHGEWAARSLSDLINYSAKLPQQEPVALPYMDYKAAPCVVIGFPNEIQCAVRPDRVASLGARIETLDSNGSPILDEKSRAIDIVGKGEWAAPSIKDALVMAAQLRTPNVQDRTKFFDTREFPRRSGTGPTM